MGVVPEAAGIAVGRIFVGLAVVVGALVTIILQGIDAESLAEGPLTYRSMVEVMPPPAGASGMQERRLMAVMFWPVLLVHFTDWPVAVSWT